MLVKLKVVVATVVVVVVVVVCTMYFPRELFET